MVAGGGLRGGFRGGLRWLAGVGFGVGLGGWRWFCFLTGKSFTKKMKTVYGKIFRKPFSKTREAFCSLPLLSFSTLCSLPLLSFSALSTLCYLSLLSLFAGPIGFVFLYSLGLIRFVEAESGTNTESFKIDAGAARTDRRRPRSGPDEAGENI